MERVELRINAIGSIIEARGIDVQINGFAGGVNYNTLGTTSGPIEIQERRGQ